MSRPYGKDADGALIIFDIGDRATFTQLAIYFKRVKQYTKHDSVKLLIGNKKDIPSESLKVTREEAEDCAAVHECECMEVSAKTGENVQKALEAVVAEIVGRIPDVQLFREKIRYSRFQEKLLSSLAKEAEKDNNDKCSVS